MTANEAKLKIDHIILLFINNLIGGAKGSRTPDLLNAMLASATGVFASVCPGFIESQEVPRQAFALRFAKEITCAIATPLRALPILAATRSAAATSAESAT
jgi:hypothetical protein